MNQEPHLLATHCDPAADRDPPLCCLCPGFKTTICQARRGGTLCEISIAFRKSSVAAVDGVEVKRSLAGPHDGLRRRQCSAITLAPVGETRRVGVGNNTAAAPAQCTWTTTTCSHESFISMAASRRCQPSNSASLNAGRSAGALSADGASRPSMLSTIILERTASVSPSQEYHFKQALPS